MRRYKLTHLKTSSINEESLMKLVKDHSNNPQSIDRPMVIDTYNMNIGQMQSLFMSDPTQISTYIDDIVNDWTVSRANITNFRQIEQILQYSSKFSKLLCYKYPLLIRPILKNEYQWRRKSNHFDKTLHSYGRDVTLLYGYDVRSSCSVHRLIGLLLKDEALLSPCKVSLEEWLQLPQNEPVKTLQFFKNFSNEDVLSIKYLYY